MYLPCLQYVSHAPTVQFLSILSPEWYCLLTCVLVALNKFLKHIEGLWGQWDQFCNEIRLKKIARFSLSGIICYKAATETAEKPACWLQFFHERVSVSCYMQLVLTERLPGSTAMFRIEFGMICYADMSFTETTSWELKQMASTLVFPFSKFAHWLMIVTYTVNFT